MMREKVEIFALKFGLYWLVSFSFVIYHLSFSVSARAQQSGKASFYAKRATGSRTANGERLHHDSMTCAHRSYPFGTMLKVTNVLNGRQVVVRVNDRGPFRRGRIIDLSWGAAKAIGMISHGVVPVTVELLRRATIPFKPEEDDLDLPQLDFEVADIEATDDLIPIWQQDAQIDHHKVRQSMQRTATQSARKSKEQP